MLFRSKVLISGIMKELLLSRCTHYFTDTIKERRKQIVVLLSQIYRLILVNSRKRKTPTKLSYNYHSQQMEWKIKSKSNYPAVKQRKWIYFFLLLLLIGNVFEDFLYSPFTIFLADDNDGGFLEMWFSYFFLLILNVSNSF